MDWKKVAIEDLRKYPRLKQSLENIPEKMKALEESNYAIKSGFRDREPVSGGTSKGEDRLIDNICEIEKLRFNYAVAKKQVAIIEKAFTMLDEKERIVLTEFYIFRKKNYIERLCEEFGCEVAQIYRMKDHALRKFTESAAGYIDL